jgi:hypothetical protein
MVTYRWLLSSNCPGPMAAVGWIKSSSGGMAAEICPRQACRTNLAAASDVTPAMFLSVQSSSGLPWQGVNDSAVRMTIASIARIGQAYPARPALARLLRLLTASYPSAELVLMYWFFKDFAGPIAVIIASGTAAWITYKLGMIQVGIARRQAKTAEAQKDIAYDKLKHDLFDQRYEIYVAAKRLIEAIFDAPLGDDIKRHTDPEIKRLRLKLDEARFFFPPDTRAYCETIEKHVYDVLVASRAITDIPRVVLSDSN